MHTASIKASRPCLLPSKKSWRTFILSLLKTQGAALLVMGAYGHSRIRHLIVGSTTTTLLRLSEVPVLVLR